MKRIIIHIIINVIANSISAQIATDYGAPMKWDKYDRQSKYVMKGLDTLSNDSILIDKEKYLRQNQKGIVIEEIIFSKLDRHISCSDEGPELTGYWTSYYSTGEIKEIGKIVCNEKFGEWLYFYKSGQIRKFEKYDEVEMLDSNTYFGNLNGTYLEYYPNGKIKISGSYRIIEENVEYFIFDFESYKELKKCCTWVPKSIKNGEWREFDDNGRTIKVESFNLDVNESSKFRELADRYLEININDIQKK